MATIVKDNSKKGTIKCPLCGGKAHHKEVYTDRADAPVPQATHAWVCDDCPMVMFEYYSKPNVEALSLLLEGGNF